MPLHNFIPVSREYAGLERKLWKVLHEERHRKGIIKSWNLYQGMTSKPDIRYQYIAVIVFDDFGRIDYFDLEGIVNTAGNQSKY